jgi:DNA (cytosine-5)-methyltransferase 1
MAWGVYEPAIRRHERVLGRSAPYPLDGSRLSARFVEWMQMMPAGWVTDVLSRNASIRVLGNAVVPPQAVAALNAVLDARQEAA